MKMAATFSIIVVKWHCIRFIKYVTITATNYYRYLPNGLKLYYLGNT